MSHQTTLFLASSSELKAERAAIETLIYRLSKLWQPEGVFLRLEVWEDFIDSLSRTRKQDDYNAAVRAADLFVVLVNTKVGPYTGEEFEVAHQAFKAGSRPLIWTYVKNPPSPGEPDPGPEYHTVRAFLAKLAGLGHFPNWFHDSNGLLLALLQQLLKLRAGGVIKGSAAVPAATAGIGYQATVTGSGAIAQGPGAVAAGAGGVAIGGGNSGAITIGPRSEIHTGGGAYFGGPVSVSGGDLIGRDKIVHGAVPAEVATAFAALQAELTRFAAVVPAPPPLSPAAVPDKALPQAMAEALQAEAAKPAAERSDGRMARLVDGLLQLVPGALGGVLQAFASPVPAGLAGPATQAVLAAFRRDRGE